MLDDKDVQKLIDVFITREEFNEKISNLATKGDINKVLTAIDTYQKGRCLLSRNGNASS